MWSRKGTFSVFRTESKPNDPVKDHWAFSSPKELNSQEPFFIVLDRTKPMIIPEQKDNTEASPMVG